MKPTDYIKVNVCDLRYLRELASDNADFRVVDFLMNKYERAFSLEPEEEWEDVTDRVGIFLTDTTYYGPALKVDNYKIENNRILRKKS